MARREASNLGRPKGYRLNRDAFDHLLEQSRLTATSVAADAGVSISTLSGLRSGKHCASTDVAGRIADVMGCRVGVLFPEATYRFSQSDSAPEAAA